MSKITLEDLRRDFEAALDEAEALEWQRDPTYLLNFFAVEAAWIFDPTTYVGADVEDIRALHLRCWKATKLYVIARDEGMDAALMWKLAN